MTKPDRGKVVLFGKKLTHSFDLWNDIGYLVETPYSYPNLSVFENLMVYYKLRLLNKPGLIQAIITKLKLTNYKNIKAKFLSLGNQQRLGLAKALMHNPKLLILDEPINGLDPEGIVEIRRLLTDLAQNGSTIFLSSHILGEISKVANRIGIIHEGKLLKEITTQELKNQLFRKIILNTTDNSGAMIQLLNSNYSATLNANNEIEISDKNAIEHPEHISKLLVERGFPPRQLNLLTEDLEMYFLRTIKTSA